MTDTEKTEQEKQSELAKKHGALRAQFIRRHCLAWMEKYKKPVLEKFEAEAWKKYPSGEKSSEFELDESLLAE